MDDAELLSILSDAGDGLEPGIGWKAVHDHVVALVAERDRLRAANAFLQERDQDWERYCTNQALIDAGKVVWLEACVRELEDQRDRLRAVCDAVGAESIADVVAERDRLRERSIRDQETDGAILDLVAPSMPGTNSGDELVGLVRGVVEERDRLRAVVEAVLAMWNDLTAVDEDGTHYQFPAAHYAPIDDGLDALGLLDVSPTGEDT